MLSKYKLRKKEVRKKGIRKKIFRKIITVYLLIYRAGGPAIADYGAEYLSRIPVSGLYTFV